MTIMNVSFVEIFLLVGCVIFHKWSVIICPTGLIIMLS